MLRRRGLVPLLVLLGPTGLGATAVGAGFGVPADRIFLVSISGEQETVVSHHASSTSDLGCTTTEDARERQTLRFTSTLPARVWVRGRTLPPASVPVRVTITGASRSLTTFRPPGCGDVQPIDEETSSCGPRTAPGRVAIRPVGAAGGFRVGGVLLRAADRSRCAPNRVDAYPFLLSTHGMARPADLANPRTQQITLRGVATLVDRVRQTTTKTTTVRFSIVLRRAP